MLKTTKRYVINTNRVNNFGYRVLSEGIDRTDYGNNPIMLWMHYRPTGASTDEWLALGNVREIEIDADGVMTGQPYFDDTDPKAVAIYNKYENGTYNMLSLLAKPTEASIEPEDMLADQIGPTFTKSILKEISCVDIGGNPDAYGVMLADDDGNEIKLSDEYIRSITPLKINNNEMSKKLIESIGTLLPELKLSDAFPDSEKTAAIEGLIVLADKLKIQSTEALAKAQTAETKLADAIKLADVVARTKMIADAETDRKITKEEGVLLLELSDNTEKLKKLLDSKPTNPTIQSVINSNTNTGKSAELIKLADMTYDELFAIEGGLAKLKLGDPDTYKQKFEEKFPNAK